jgi:hypothetical protein
VAVKGDVLDFDVETGGAAELIQTDEEKKPAAASL